MKTYYDNAPEDGDMQMILSHPLTTEQEEAVVKLGCVYEFDQDDGLIGGEDEVVDVVWINATKEQRPLLIELVKSFGFTEYIYTPK